MYMKILMKCDGNYNDTTHIIEIFH